MQKFQSWVLLFAALSFLGLQGCKQDKNSSDKGDQASLVLGTSADMPPFEFFQTGQGQATIVGFDMDVAQALGKMIGVDIKVKDMDFSTLIPALQAGRVDLVMASMTPTPEREKSVTFTKPYLTIHVAAISLGKTFKKAKDLEGHRIGVQLGTTHEEVLKEMVKAGKQVTPVSLNKLGELIQELIAGRIQVVLMETTSAKAFAASNPQLIVSELKDLEVTFAIAFPKQSLWVEKFNKAIDHLQKSKQIEALKETWFQKKP